MRNILDEIDISQIKGIDKPILPLWVYGTLRTGRRFHYYLVDCSTKVGEYQMDGTLMQMVSGDVFVRKDDLGQKTTGELYRVSLAGLWRIFHLENQSGSFPKAYDLDVSDVFNVESGKKDVALWFRRREEEALPCQDYNKHKTLLEELAEHIKFNPNLSQNDIDGFLRAQLAVA